MSVPLIDRFEALLEKVELKFRRSSSHVSYDTKQYANRRLTEIAPSIQEITRENAYQHFLLDEIQAAQERFKHYTEFRESDVKDVDEFLDGRYYDTVREEPVCTCRGKRSHNCPLKRGRLPIEVRQADSIDDGIREFKAAHNGRPLVLLDAQRAFSERVASVEADLRDLLAVLSTDEIPRDAPEGRDIDTAGDDAEQPAD
ncbi:MAG: hypothetical protein ACOCQV_02830 [Halolamina sp.]